MSKEIKKPFADKVLGKVKRVIKSSGMLELTSGEKIPPFPNVEVGDTIEIKDKRYHVKGKGVAGAGKSDDSDEVALDGDALKKENAKLKADFKKQDVRLKNLEKIVGAKGAKGEIGEKNEK